MAMDQNAPVRLKMSARDSLATRSIGVQGRAPRDDVLAFERAVALANLDIVVCGESHHTVVKRFVLESKPEIPAPALFPSGLRKVKSDCRNFPS